MIFLPKTKSLGEGGHGIVGFIKVMAVEGVVGVMRVEVGGKLGLCRGCCIKASAIGSSRN